MVYSIDDIVSDIMRLLRTKYNLECDRYAPATYPRIECELPDWGNYYRKLIIMLFITSIKKDVVISNK